MAEWTSDKLSLEPDVARLVATLEHAPIGIAHVRSDGSFSFVNEHFCAIVDYERIELLAHSFPGITHPQDVAPDISIAIRDQMYAGTLRTHTREMRLIRKDGGWVWVRIHVKLAPGYDSTPPFFLVVEDVSARRRAERRLAAQTSVTQILANAPHFNDAAPLLLASIGELLDCVFAQIWCVDGQTHVTTTSVWQASDSDQATYAQLRTVTSFAKGQGIPGLVWDQLTPLWFDTLSDDPDCPRHDAFALAGIQSAFALPIRSSTTFFGAVEFFSEQPRSLDEELLTVLGAFGRQIGEYIERRRAEIAVKQRDQALSYQAHLLNTVDQAIIGTDADGWITYWNHSAERLYGWSANEALGRSLSIVLPAPLPRQDHDALMAQLRRGETWTSEMVLQRRDSTLFHAAVTDTPVLDADGTMIGIVGVFIDISARKREEERLRFLDDVSSRLAVSIDYEATLTELTQLMVPHIADWCAIDLIEASTVNRVAALHVDPAQEERLRSLVWHDTCSQAPTALLPAERQVFFDAPHAEDTPIQNVRSTDAIVTFGSRCVVVVPLIARGRTLGAIVLGTQATCYDTAQLDMFDELAHRAALAIDNALLYRETQRAVKARDEFLSIAAHELRTPLTSLVGYTQMIKRRLSRTLQVSDRDLQGLDTVVGQADRMSRLMTLLLDVSRMESGHFALEYEQVDLCVLMQRVLEALQPSLHSGQGKPHIVYECVDDHVMVVGDVLRLEQVVYNLVQNAVKYSPDGGTITISMNSQPDCAVLAIRDQGIGIPAAAIPLLFNRFYRVEHKQTRSISGVGIGLYVVRAIVERHHGTIDVHSVEGEGTTFTIFLPYEQPTDD